MHDGCVTDCRTGTYRRFCFRSALPSRVWAAAGSASAQDHRQNAPGEFDFYVLALSWSPSFCKETAERGNARAPTSSAAAPTPSSFTGCGRSMNAAFRAIARCRRPAHRDIMTSMLDLMPAPGLIYHEWDQHGTCSGLGAGLFRAVRKARKAVKIPDES